MHKRNEAIIGNGLLATPITDRDRMDLQCARLCMTVLETNFPGYIWFVEVDGAQGMIHIRNLDLSGERGYSLHLKGHASASELDKLVRDAGGEILERYNQPREKADQDKLELAERDATGRKVFDA